MAPLEIWMTYNLLIVLITLFRDVVQIDVPLEICVTYKLLIVLITLFRDVVQNGTLQNSFHVIRDMLVRYRSIRIASNEDISYFQK